MRLEIGLGKDEDEERLADYTGMEVDEEKLPPQNWPERELATSRTGGEELGRLRPSVGEATSMPLPPATRIPLAQDQVINRATIVHPTTPDPPIRVDTVPHTQSERVDSEDPLAPDSTAAPLQAASNDLYPAPVGPPRSGFVQAGSGFAPAAAPAPASSNPASIATTAPVGLTPGQHADDGDDDDDGEPLPELDSDMDLSEDEQADDE